MPPAGDGREALQAILRRKPVSNLLFIGAQQDAEKLLAGLPKRPRLSILKPDDAALEKLNHCWELCIIYHALHRLGWKNARLLLSRLRDVSCQAVYLCWRHGDERGELAGLQDRLRALAYTMMEPCGEDCLAYFDMNDYKQTPDWLNARHWARPELWDKFRW